MANRYMRKCPVSNHQGNANQYYDEISFHTCQDGFYQKNKTTNGEDVEKREPSFTVGRNAREGDPLENSMTAP